MNKITNRYLVGFFKVEVFVIIVSLLKGEGGEGSNYFE